MITSARNSCQFWSIHASPVCNGPVTDAVGTPDGDGITHENIDGVACPAVQLHVSTPCGHKFEHTWPHAVIADGGDVVIAFKH